MPLKFLERIGDYLHQTEPGSFVDTVRKRQPKIGSDEIIADLHAHPYITDKESLLSTLNIQLFTICFFLTPSIHYAIQKFTRTKFIFYSYPSQILKTSPTLIWKWTAGWSTSTPPNFFNQLLFTLLLTHTKHNYSDF